MSATKNQFSLPGGAPKKRFAAVRTAYATKLLPVLLLLTLPAVVQSQNLAYTVNNGTITITGFTGRPTNVTIPSTINVGGINLPVTTIGYSAFYDCTSLSTVTIPPSVTSIGTQAFSVCYNLTGIYFEGNAPSLGSWVFDNGWGDYDPATVYYSPWTTGWYTPFGGLQAVPCQRSATAIATVMGGFVVATTITDGGFGYTNTPVVWIEGGGGTGAGATAAVSNGVVSITITNAGIGYTSTPLVVIEPPCIFNPVLSLTPMSFLAFSNLTLGGVYQLQQSVAWYWSNQPVSFTATNALYTQMVAGVVGSGDYRLALNPLPSQAFATPKVTNGFVVGATLTSGGSGYFTSPAVTIVGGGGTNAMAVSEISGGVVTNITITDAGIGYTNTPTIRIAPPPVAAVSPTVLPVMRLDSSSLSPFDSYQIQFKPDLDGAWANWNRGLFSPTNVTSSQYVFITNGVGFFRLQYVP
jgi:hypothetical protein